MRVHPSGPRSVVASAPELAVFLRTQVYPTHCGERLRSTQWTCEVSPTSRAWLAGASTWKAPRKQDVRSSASQDFGRLHTGMCIS